MKQINLNQLISVLELPASCLNFTKQPYQRALVGIKVFKELINKQRKLLAKKYHPDRNGGDGSKMKEINNVVDLLLTIEVKPLPPPQLRPMVFHYHFTNYHYGNSTTVTHTWTS